MVDKIRVSKPGRVATTPSAANYTDLKNTTLSAIGNIITLLSGTGQATDITKDIVGYPTRITVTLKATPKSVISTWLLGSTKLEQGITYRIFEKDGRILFEHKDPIKDDYRKVSYDPAEDLRGLWRMLGELMLAYNYTSLG